MSGRRTIPMTRCCGVPSTTGSTSRSVSTTSSTARSSWSSGRSGVTSARIRSAATRSPGLRLRVALPLRNASKAVFRTVSLAQRQLCLRNGKLVDAVGNPDQLQHTDVNMLPLAKDRISPGPAYDEDAVLLKLYRAAVNIDRIPGAYKPVALREEDPRFWPTREMTLNVSRPKPQQPASVRPPTTRDTSSQVGMPRRGRGRSSLSKGSC